MSEREVSERLGGLEARLARLETLLGTLHDKLDRSSGGGLEDAKAGIQAWVTDYVSLRLQQIVPETCEHAPDEAVATDGPVLPATGALHDECCTAVVPSRSVRRQMVTEKVAETARAENVTVIDVRSSSGRPPSDSASSRGRISRASSTGRAPGAGPRLALTRGAVRIRSRMRSTFRLRARDIPPGSIEYLRECVARGFTEVRLIQAAASACPGDRAVAPRRFIRGWRATRMLRPSAAAAAPPS